MWGSNVDLDATADGGNHKHSHSHSHSQNQNQGKSKNQNENKKASTSQARRAFLERSSDVAAYSDGDTERGSGGLDGDRERYAYASRLGEEFDDHDPLDDDTNARIIDPETGRELDCHINQVVELNGIGYAVCYPLDQPVVIATLTNVAGGFEQELVAIEDEKHINKLFPIAYAIASENDMILTRSAYVMTIAGYEDDFGEYEESETEDGGSESESSSYEDSDEDVEVLFEFYHENVEYMVCKPLDPVLFVARPMPPEQAGDVENAYYVPEKDELDAILPQVEAAMESSIIGDA